MKTFSTLALAGSYTLGVPGEVLVGRLVANTEFIKALFRYSAFESFCFFTGESNDAQSIQRLFLESGWITEERLLIKNLLELPTALKNNEISLVHHNSSLDLFFHLIWLRNRFATSPIPVTTQIHSLSYPREMINYLLSYFISPSERDAVFCSSTAGKQIIENCLQALAEHIKPYGLLAPPLRLELPIIPLGIEVEPLQQGNRLNARHDLGIPPEAFVLLSIGRFTEYDKMDLFPLLQAFGQLLQSSDRPERPLFLLLAGARQGTKTPESVLLWSKMLKIEERVRIQVDFTPEDKAHLLAAADMFVSPCDNPQETFGLSVVEAMAAGLPVVVSDFNGYKDTVTEEVGIRVTTRWGADLQALSDLGPLLYERPLHLFLGQSVEVDMAELISGLRRIYQDDQLRAKLAQNAHLRAKNLYHWPVVIRQYEQTWQRLAQKPLELERSTEATQHHPLALDFTQAFAHYPTEFLSPQRLVQRTEFSYVICGPNNYYPIYAEATHIIDDELVLLGLRQAEHLISVQELTNAIQAKAPHRPTWHASYLVAWLLKHGLLE